MPYYVYEVRQVSPQQTPEFEPLQDTLAGYGASLEAYWPAQTGGQVYLAVSASSFEVGVAGVLDDYTDGIVAFVADGVDVESAFPTPLPVCAGCGASPPRHIAQCRYQVPDRIDDDTAM